MRRVRSVWMLALWVSLPAIAAEAPPRFGRWSDAAEVVTADGPAVVRVPTAALILSGQSGGSIPLAVLATPLPAAGGESRVSVLTEIGGSAFEGEEPEIGVEVFVYALDAAGSVAGAATQSFRLERARHGPRLLGGLEVFTPLALAPGEYTLRVLVRHLESGELGVGGWPLTVPAWGDETTVLLPPWLLASAAGRLVALPPAATEVEGATTAPLVLFDGTDRDTAEPHLPSAAPRLEAARTAVGCVLARWSPPPGALLRARFELGDGMLAAELALAIQDRRPSPWPGLEVLWFALRIPDLPAGPYRLRLALVAAGADAAEAPALGVEVTGPQSPRLAAVPELLGEVEPTAGDRPSLRRRRRLRLPAGEIEAGYRQALRRLADGDEPTARALLAAVEHRAAGPANLALGDLAEIEWRTVAAIAGDSWQGVLPVVQLHARLIDDYRRRQAVHLVEHALRMSVRLAEELASRAASPAARAEAVQALADLGGRLQRLQRLAQSDTLLAAAVALDDGHAAVRLALAANDERRGRYPEAVAELEALVERHPDHPEGRLRLALNLARVGRRQEARDLLAELTAIDLPDWIAELAFQEGARLALLDRQPDLARGLLERALRRWSGHPTASIQLASVLDRLGRPHAARETLRGLGKPVPEPRHGSARVRYGEWPSELRRIEPLLAASCELRRADLGRLLAPPAAADAP